MSSYIAVEAQVKKSRPVSDPVSDLDYLVAIQRAGIVMHHFDLGEGLTVRDVANMTGTSERNARYMLVALAAVLPIYDDHGTWQLLVFKELEQ